MGFTAELGGGMGKKPQIIMRALNIDVARQLDGFAGVFGFGLGQLLMMFGNGISQLF